MTLKLNIAIEKLRDCPVTKQFRKPMEGFTGGGDCLLNCGRVEFTRLNAEERREEALHSPNLIWLSTTTRHFSPAGVGLKRERVPVRWYESEHCSMQPAPEGWCPKNATKKGEES